MAGISRHYYDGHYWPLKIESCNDERVLSWLESHICLVPMFPPSSGLLGGGWTGYKSEEGGCLTSAADSCWSALLDCDLTAFAEAFRRSFEAQIAMFPAMMQPGVEEYIEQWR